MLSMSHDFRGKQTGKVRTFKSRSPLKGVLFGICKNDSQYPESWKRNSNGDPVKFLHLDKTREGKSGYKVITSMSPRWLVLVHERHWVIFTFVVYIFLSGNGPIKEDPDPEAAVASKRKGNFIYLGFCNTDWSNIRLSNILYRSWVSRLNRKRKASCEREADKARSKKICLERSVAKTPLTLNCHTEKYEEEAAILNSFRSELRASCDFRRAWWEKNARIRTGRARLVSRTDRFSNQYKDCRWKRTRRSQHAR